MRGKQRLHLIAATVTVALLLAAGPAAAEMLHFDLWDHTPAYNGNHAKTSFDLDPNYNVLGGTLDITAYNADPLYWRVVNFYLGGEQGDGGAIGVYYESPGQVRGSGVMVQLEQKHWVYDLSMVMIADGNEPNGYRYVDFIQIINDILQGSKTDIDVEAWVTSAETGCWVSAFIDLNAEWTGGDDDDDDDDDSADDDDDTADDDDDIADDDDDTADDDDDSADDDDAGDDDAAADDDDDDDDDNGGCLT